MIKIYYKSVKSSGLTALDNFKIGAWVDVCDPNKEELEKLENMLGVEKSLLHDALDPYEVPRMEQEDGITYVFTRVPQYQEKEVLTLPILVALGENFLLTVSKEKLNFLEKFSRGQIAFSTTQKTKLLLEIFFHINKQYDFFLVDIGKKIRGLKIKLEKISNRELIQFVDLESVLNDFLSSLTPTNAVLRKILDGRSLHLYEEDRDLVEDIFLGNGQIIEMASSTLNQVVNIRNTSSSIITHELNRVMKILTVLTILLTIPTMVFSFYGMNVALPAMNNPTTYISILFYTFTFSLLAMVLFKKNRWL